MKKRIDKMIKRLEESPASDKKYLKSLSYEQKVNDIIEISFGLFEGWVRSEEKKRQ